MIFFTERLLCHKTNNFEWKQGERDWSFERLDENVTKLEGERAAKPFHLIFEIFLPLRGP